MSYWRERARSVIAVQLAAAEMSGDTVEQTIERIDAVGVDRG